MQETGKQRASRIPLDYFKSPDYYARWKGRLTLVGFIAALVYGTTVFLPNGESQFSRGPVAHVHAIWDSQCTACHVPFEPISEHTWSKPLFANTGNERCINCHAGPPHHATATPDLSCSACHREHRGREASLIRLADQDCTRCHADLVAHTMLKKTDFKNVTEFSKSGHPDFRFPEKVSRGLKFSHARHMSAGMTLPGQDKQTGFRVRDLDAADRERYAPGAKDLDAAVQLNCASCHQLEAGDFPAKDAPSSLRPRGGVGDYMLPITYDNQCKACHPLTLKTPPGPLFARGGEVLHIPHGLQPKPVKEFVWGAIAERRVRKLLEDWQVPPGRPLPGKEYSAMEKKVAAEIDELVTNRVEKFLYREAVTDAEKLLFLGEHTCGRCHEVNGEGPSRKITPTQVPNVWLKHARFNHARHRALDCLACHDKAMTSGREGLVLLPRMENCLQCHEAQAGAARSDCTECHTYHHRTGAAGTGVGAAARDPQLRFRELRDFLIPK